MDSGRPGPLGAGGEREGRDNNDSKVFQED